MSQISINLRFRPLDQSQVEVKHTIEGRRILNIFGQDASQEDVFDEVGVPLVTDFLKGQDVSLFAYGQSSAGKTHTILGSKENCCIIFKCFDLLEQELSAQTDRITALLLAIYEVFKGRIYDLNDDSQIKELQANKDGYFIENLKQLDVKHKDQPGLDNFTTFATNFKDGHCYLILIHQHNQMASKYLQKYPVPDGFNQILHDFSREVLRDQPEDIIKYGAEYFECLNLGKEFKYESKFNIAKNQAPIKEHRPPKPSDLTSQAKKVVDESNNRPPSNINQRVPSARLPSATLKQTSRENINNVSHASSRGTHPEEKNAAKEYVNEIYTQTLKGFTDLGNDTLQEGVDQMLNQQEEVEEKQLNAAPEAQTEVQEQLLNAEDFNEDQMQKLIKIQAAAKGSIQRKQIKSNQNQKSSQSSALDKVSPKSSPQAEQDEFKHPITPQAPQEEPGVEQVDQ